MNKRVFGLSILSSLIIFGFLPFVNAQYFRGTSFEQGIVTIVDTITQFLRPIFEAFLGYSSTSEFFFAKSLLAILIFVICLSVLRKVPTFENNKNVRVIIALVVSILSIRFLPESDLINAILLPYSAFGIAITTLLPFVIFGYFLHTANVGAGGRKAGWALFAVILTAIWYTTRDNFTTDFGNYMYWGIVLAAVLLLLFDSSVHKYFEMGSFHEYRRKVRDERIANLQADIARLTSSGLPSREQQRVIEYKNKEILRLIHNS
jgi:hypothetical protein